MGKLIGELLVEAKAITREKLEDALRIQREPGKKLGQLLLERGLVTEAHLTQCLSFQLSVPWVSLYHIDFSRQLLARVPREIAERHCLVPIYVRHVKGAGDTLYVAIEDPMNNAGMGEVSKAAGLPVRAMIAAPSDIRSAIRVYYGPTDGAGEPITAPGVPNAVAPSTPERSGVTERKPEPPPLPPKRAKPTTPDAAPARGSPASRPPLAPSPPSSPAPAMSASSASSSLSASAALAASEPSPAAILASRTDPPPPLDENESDDGPDVAPDIEARELPLTGRRPRMRALTLLDGTSLALPARPRRKSEPAPASGMAEQLTTRDLVSALRALSHGADVTEILGDHVHWETMFAALLSLLLRKGIIADWEFVDELRKG